MLFSCWLFFLLSLLLLCTGQKISPDGKAKVQLQLVLHTGESTTFHFANESTALKDRDAAKELLQQLLPKFKKKANKELEEKNRWASAPFTRVTLEDRFYYCQPKPNIFFWVAVSLDLTWVGPSTVVPQTVAFRITRKLNQHKFNLTFMMMGFIPLYQVSLVFGAL